MQNVVAHSSALRLSASIRADQNDLPGALKDLHTLQALGDETVAVRIHVAWIWKRMKNERAARIPSEKLIIANVWLQADFPR